MGEGRPTKYTDNLAQEICDGLIDGQSLNKICASDDMPCKASVYGWLADSKHTIFLDMYTCARERQAETFMDQCVDIADDNEDDTVTAIGKDGQEYQKVNHDHINRSRLRVDTRIKIAERMAPRKYAIQHLEVKADITGEVRTTTDEETLRRLAFMLRNKEESGKE